MICNERKHKKLSELKLNITLDITPYIPVSVTRYGICFQREAVPGCDGTYNAGGENRTTNGESLRKSL